MIVTVVFDRVPKHEGSMLRQGLQMRGEGDNIVGLRLRSVPRETEMEP